MIWVGRARAQDTKQNDAIQEINAVAKDVAKQHPTRVFVDDLRAVPDANGKYSDRLPDADGKT